MRKDRVIHLFFDIGVIAKGIDGALEIVGGAVLMFLSSTQLYGIVHFLTQHELSEDPRDRIAQYLLHSTHSLASGTRVFAASYLLWHGAVKVVLVAGLLRKQRWAYPLAIGAFLLFLVYQLYRYSHTHAVELLVLSVADVLVIALTWLEFRRLVRSRAFA